MIRLTCRETTLETVDQQEAEKRTEEAAAVTQVKEDGQL